MISLHHLKDITVYRKSRKRVGRGAGSKLGKTCGRGEKGAGARSGYKRRHTYEGGQFRMFQKMPIRGFSNARFRKALDAINLEQINAVYQDGEVVNHASLVKYGFLKGKSHGIKILGNGEATKKVKYEVDAISKSAKEKLQNSKSSLTLLK